LFGINTKNKKNGEIYNSLVAVNSSFEKIYQYNKKKLVPFGEFIPFEKQFNKLGLKKITEGHGSFARGAVQENLLINDLNILPLICYEIIFPEMIQKMNQDTNLIINVSEDAWFGKSIGPHQHFAKAIFRAVESNTILARSANQGITAFIDNRGKVIKRLEPYEAGNIELEILLNSSNYKNRNDLIFFVLLITYTIIFFTLRNKL
jgi:apolipoprotein N-acyltransferase